MALSGHGTSLIIVSTFMAFFAMLFHAVAFACPNWLEAKADSGTPFDKIGWHEACFTECRYPYCPGGDQLIYTGCYWLFDIYYQEISWWLLPHWFLKVRDYSIIMVPLTAVIFFVLLLASCIVGYWRYPRTKTAFRDNCLSVTVIIASIFCLAATIIGVILLSEFAVNCYEYSWLPMPEKNQFGFSYWLEVITVTLLGLSFLCTLFAFVYKNVGYKTPRDHLAAEDMMMGGMSSRY